VAIPVPSLVFLQQLFQPLPPPSYNLEDFYQFLVLVPKNCLLRLKVKEN
jgi:hypothetical protein